MASKNDFTKRNKLIIKSASNGVVYIKTSPLRQKRMLKLNALDLYRRYLTIELFEKDKVINLQPTVKDIAQSIRDSEVLQNDEYGFNEIL